MPIAQPTSGSLEFYKTTRNSTTSSSKKYIEQKSTSQKSINSRSKYGQKCVTFMAFIIIHTVLICEL